MKVFVYDVLKLLRHKPGCCMHSELVHFDEQACKFGRPGCGAAEKIALHACNRCDSSIAALAVAPKVCTLCK